MEGRREAPAAGRRPAGGGLRLGRFAGVEVVVDASLMIIFALVTMSLAVGLFPQWHPAWSPARHWLVAFAAAFLFFGSVLVHELSHAVVAGRRGVPVQRITLFIFGGMAHMVEEPLSPRDEFLIAIAGPLASLTIGVLSLGAVLLFWPPPAGATAEEAARAVGRLGSLPTLLLWLGPINILLALFNLVPGFPLDGGRVLRSLLWWATGDLRKSTRWASRVGQGVAWLLIGSGVAMALGVRLPVFGVGLLPGVWLVLIGWFLNNAAKLSYRQLEMKQALQDVLVADLMRTQVSTVEPETSLDVLVRDHIMRSDQRAFPVLSGEELVGLVCLEDLRRVEPADWPLRKVADVMTPAARLATISPDEAAQNAMAALAEKEVDQLPVVDRGHVLGLVRRQDIMKWLTLHSAGSPG